MPARLLRESILDSEAVCSLKWEEEVFYRRLMSVVDDFGRFDGRASVLRAKLYPLQVERVREADISRWIAACVKAGLIVLYATNGAGCSRLLPAGEKAGQTLSGDERPYLFFRKLGKPRATESKFPAPPSDCGRLQPFGHDDACAQMNADESSCAQVKTVAPYSYSVSDSITDAGAGAGSGRSGEPAPPASPPVLTFPTVGDGPKTWPLTAEQLDRWRGLYPGTDVLAECRKALGWCEANPKKLKTAGGMAKFLVNWLNNAANSGKPQSPGTQRPPPAKSKAQERDDIFAQQMFDAYGIDPGEIP
jgi:hypothetical protein